MKCQLLMTGNELITGVTVDSNSSWIAEQLLDIGIPVTKKVVVGDVLADLEEEMRDAIWKNDLLIINGGLGPTVDDLTALALANATQRHLTINNQAVAHVHKWCSERGIPANEANLRQAKMPSRAEIIPNSTGSATGIRLEYQNCLILCTPGVPDEMRLMVEKEILPLLQRRFSDCKRPHIKKLQLFGMGESTIQQKICDQYPEWPPEVELGFRAGFPTLEVKLTVQDKNHLPLRDEWESNLRILLGSVIFGEGSDSLASVVVEALQQQHKKITTAESCTGGLIAATITSIAGASEVFEAGFVTYSNAMKEKLLEVSIEDIKQHGAVSEPTVLQMLRGALEKSGADYGVAVSGIAGPEGGTTDKPVGTVWIAWGSRHFPKTHRIYCPMERKRFQTLVSAYALDLIRRDVLNITEKPRYLR